MTFRWPLVARADCLGAAAKAREVLTEAGWSPKEASELAVVVAELANNAVRHAGGGECTLELEARAWELCVSDEGPGFPDEILADAGRTDGVQPRRGMGSGLSCARRMSCALSLENRRPKGARIVARQTRCKRSEP
ncbi:MAG: ATP-binding protein [Archangiaceae bacterium]|nr:ATP-binding protein [Archangiaceae bacterium]